MQQRLILCLLLAGLMLYYGLPRLDFGSSGAELIFTVTWVLFAFFIVAGNLAALLFLPREKREVRISARKNERMRTYGR
ncbi:MAG: hypothetical protein ACI4XL_13980 [Bacillus sp. (in: firmicutes)]